MITLLIFLAIATGIVLTVMGFAWIRQQYDVEYQYYGCAAFVVGLILFITGSGLSVYFLR